MPVLTPHFRLFLWFAGFVIIFTFPCLTHGQVLPGANRALPWVGVGILNDRGSGDRLPFLRLQQLNPDCVPALENGRKAISCVLLLRNNSFPFLLLGTGSICQERFTRLHWVPQCRSLHKGNDGVIKKLKRYWKSKSWKDLRSDVAEVPLAILPNLSIRVLTA